MLKAGELRGIGFRRTPVDRCRNAQQSKRAGATQHRACRCNWQEPPTRFVAATPLVLPESNASLPRSFRASTTAGCHSLLPSNTHQHLRFIHSLFSSSHLQILSTLPLFLPPFTVAFNHSLGPPPVIRSTKKTLYILANPRSHPCSPSESLSHWYG
jgi:hypothetical protein